MPAEVQAPQHPVKYSQVGMQDTCYFSVMDDWMGMKNRYPPRVVFTWYSNWFWMWKGLNIPRPRPLDLPCDCINYSNWELTNEHQAYNYMKAYSVYNFLIINKEKMEIGIYIYISFCHMVNKSSYTEGRTC